MADKYLYSNSGVTTEREATVASAGAGNAGDILALDSNGKIDSSVLPSGVGAADVRIIAASENLAAGDFVNIHDSSGAKVRKADATVQGKKAHGFVLAAVASGQNATVYFEGTNDQVSGLTPGDLWLSTTPGVAVSTPPTGSGNIQQPVGVATSATSMNFEAGSLIVLA